MNRPLWTLDEVRAATGASLCPQPGSRPLGDTAITGISIDTRQIASGDLFVALKDVRDGHAFVGAAFSNGAAAALVSRTYARQPGDGLLLHVDDPLRALERLAIAARARLAPDARVIAVTGSVGKTTTKEMLRACLSRLGTTHAADKSFNNHWGVPLTLARMPVDTQFGVFEIGMNHPGEITPLTRMVAPDVAIITTVEAVHLEHFASEEGIADAKAEILHGLRPGGTIVLNADNRHFERLRSAACALPDVRIATFGTGPTGAGGIRLVTAITGDSHTDITAQRHPDGPPVAFALGMTGGHMVMNALAVAAALDAAGIETGQALDALATFGPPQGRGSRTTLKTGTGQALLIDESYNANPASMRAAFAAMATVDRMAYPCRIAVLGDMLELGPGSAALHAGLAPAILDAGIDLVFAAGPHMRHLFDALPADTRAVWAAHASGLESELLARVAEGCVVMIKGSNGSKMAPLVAALIARHTQAPTSV